MFLSRCRVCLAGYTLYAVSYVNIIEMIGKKKSIIIRNSRFFDSFVGILDVSLPLVAGNFLRIR